MKTLCVALLFVLSLLSLFASTRADAWGAPRIEPGMARPLPLLPDGGKKGGGDDKKGGDDEEKDEEEYRGISQRAALELVDPGALDHLLRLRAAVRGSR